MNGAFTDICLKSQQHPGHSLTRVLRDACLTRPSPGRLGPYRLTRRPGVAQPGTPNGAGRTSRRASAGTASALLIPRDSTRPRPDRPIGVESGLRLFALLNMDRREGGFARFMAPEMTCVERGAAIDTGDLNDQVLVACADNCSIQRVVRPIPESF